MCTVFVGIMQHERFPLVVVANRDEFLKRPTAPMHWWEEGILAGKDLQSGGTWMGVHIKGELAIITNHRDLQNIMEDAPSRGELVTRALMNSGEDFASSLENSRHLYNGYNLIYGNVRELRFYGNHNNRSDVLSEGVYGLSNASLDTAWPKVEEGKKHFKDSLKNNGNIHQLKESLLDWMGSEKTYADELLPSTGVGIEWERKLSALNIRTADYGTRVTTVLAVDVNNIVYVSELDRISGEMQEFTFQLTD